MMRTILSYTALLALSSAVMVLYAGCSGTEARGALTVTAPTLAAGTVLTLATEPRPLQFRPIQQAQVDGQHRARFVGIEPGQYRLVVYRDGSVVEFSPILPVVPGENLVAYTAERL
ncbi:MAG: hypothetical protein ACUVTZ_05445 [Armatimonadota bacterium]